jgi:nicotinate-nucleotide pyrophosphorylase (carboxylating)
MLSHTVIETIVRTALEEDLGGTGFDATSEFVIPAQAQGQALLRARQSGVLAGLIPALTAFSLLDADMDMTIHAQDGDALEAGQAIATIEGPARALLTAERTALNLLTHMSGIASLTARYVEEIKGTGATICDTRKTLPGLRTLQKYAVRMGGGSNHRFGLGDAILIKDNHIALAGGSIGEALDRAGLLAGHTLKIEIEVDTLEQLEDVIEHGGADIVMLDNMNVKTLAKAVKMIEGRMITEASGGVTLETVRAIAQTGVDYISAGSLTHSAPALDIGLDIEG